VGDCFLSCCCPPYLVALPILLLPSLSCCCPPYLVAALPILLLSLALSLSRANMAVRFNTVLLAVLVVVIGLLVHFYTLRELGQPSAEARAALLASDHLSRFARLSFGVTRYRIYSVEALAGQGLVDQGTLRRHQERFGSASGHSSAVTPELVVLVHGYALSSDLMHQLAVDLVRHWSTTAAAKPIKVLTYDLYGRGYSDAPKEPSTDALYTSQLAELLVRERRRSRFARVANNQTRSVAPSRSRSIDLSITHERQITAAVASQVTH